MDTGNIVIASTDKSVYFTYCEDVSLEQFRITESLFEIFSMPIPAFATRASIGDIHPSNMVIVSGKIPIQLTAMYAPATLASNLLRSKDLTA